MGLTDSNDQTGYAISNEAHSIEQIHEVMEICTEKIGEPQVQRLSETQLRERYDARVEQWQCFAERALVEGDPITFDTFVDEYRRSGELILWEPAAHSALTDSQGRPVSPSDLCPRNGAW